MNTVNLDTDFFSNHKIRELAEQTDGHKKIVTWLKLLCLAGKTDDDGRIYETKGEVLTRDYLASVLGITEDEVGKYLVSFKKLRMIRFDPDKTMRLTNWSKWQLNGKREAEERAERDREKENFPLIPPYKEKETEKEEKEEQEKKENPSLSEESNLYADKIREIINHLNSICTTRFKYNTPKTVVCIKARLKEGYTVDDFKKVIQSKYNEWSGTQFERYLKPDTLFSNKFEGYLQYAERENDNRSFDVDEAIQAALNRKF